MPIDVGRHPEDERLAEYVDGVLEIDERVTVERHLIECAECREVVAETTALRSNDSRSEFSFGRLIPFRSQSVRKVLAVALTAAAALVLVVRLVLPEWIGGMFGSRSDLPEMHDLIVAIGNEPTRLVEGRLTGGFKYAPAPSPTRGARNRESSPEVRIAAAKIERLAAGSDSPLVRGALGVAFLAVGDLDQAIEALDDAAQRDASNRHYQTDLSAAYLARARSRGVAEDWSKALAAADRAIKQAPSEPEAYFNRALALEGLHLTQPALEAWAAYAAVERSPEWAAESSQRARMLRDRSSSPPSSRTPLPADHQRTREFVEDKLLPEWGTAIESRDSSLADRILDQAQEHADRLAAGGGDGMPRDQIALIRRLRATGDISKIRALALGHVRFGHARAAYLQDDQKKAAELMFEASRHFADVRSPYSFWGNIYNAIFLRNKGSVPAALNILSKLPLSDVSDDYTNLRGRHEWTRGVAFNELGHFDLGVRHLSRAVDLYKRSGERDNWTATQTYLAEAEWVLGNRATAWTLLLDVFADVDRGDSRPNYFHLAVASTFSLNMGLPEASLEFENIRVGSVKTARTKAEAYLRRSRTFATLGDRRAATEDLDCAAIAVAALTDDAIRERNAADVSIARAELYSDVDSKRAVSEATTALSYVPRADPGFRLARLLAVRGKSLEALEDFDGAEADLRASIDAFEEKRARLGSAQERLRAFDVERPAFKDLVQLLGVRRGNQLGALSIAERARAGAWQPSVRSGGKPIDPSTGYRDLPAEVAVIYFETLRDRVMVWVVTRERCDYFFRPTPLASITREVSEIEQAIRRGDNLTQLRRYSERLFRDLIEPAVAMAGERPTLIFVPDGPLYSVPFAALPDRQGRPLLETRSVGIAPSFTTFMTASTRLKDFSADDVTAIGDGHDPVTTSLPLLPMADLEATTIGRLYPQRTVLTGADALVERVLASDPSVLHFAGHTVISQHQPMFSRLLFASDKSSGESGTLLASEILNRRFERTRVVVLATCNGAAGTSIDGEGVISVARAFLTAGIPSVVASLWPVDDDGDAILLLTAFHRELRARRDVVGALRASQLAFIHQTGSAMAVRKWAGFIALGGIRKVQ